MYRFLLCILYYVIFYCEEILDEADDFQKDIIKISADIENEIEDVCISAQVYPIYSFPSTRFLMKMVLLGTYEHSQVTPRKQLMSMIRHG